MPKRRDGLRGSYFARGASWVVKFPLPSGKYHWESFPINPAQPDAAQQAARDRWLALNQSHGGALLVDPAHETLGSYLDAWLERRAARRQWRHGSVQRYRWMAGAITTYLGHVPLRALDSVQIDQWAAWMQTHLPPTRAAGAFQVLSSALQDAFEAGRISRNPCRQVAAPNYRRGRGIAMHVDEWHAFCAEAASAPDGIFWLLLAESGLRIGELVAVGWSQVDLGRRTLTVARTMTESPQPGERWMLGETTKTPASLRTIALNAQHVDGLRQQRIKQAERRLRLGVAWHDLDLVFDRGDGRPLTRSPLDQRFQRLCKAAGIERRYTPHSLRHTVATLMLERGISDLEVRDILGHASTRMTDDLYGHTTADSRRRALEQLWEAPERGERSGA